MDNEEDIKKKEEEDIKKKEIAFYQASVTAWYNTSMEHDKSLFTISAGAIGLLMTLIRTVGIPCTETLICYIVAMVSFLICLITVLVIFKKNRFYIEQVVQNKSNNDSSLKNLDNVAFFSFIIAVIFSTIVGISSAINSYTAEATQMTNDNDKSKSTTVKTIQTGKITTTMAKDSFTGAEKLKPDQPKQSETTSSEQPKK